MAKITKEEALNYHRYPRPGKIEVEPTKPYASQTDLALAYSPGVAFPCKEIEAHPADIYEYTNKGNLVAVISNGTAVLGLGDIGPEAGKPVMEGKALLFKIFAGLDCFDIEVNEQDPDKFVEVVKAIAPTFGGINLEWNSSLLCRLFSMPGFPFCPRSTSMSQASATYLTRVSDLCVFRPSQTKIQFFSGAVSTTWRTASQKSDSPLVSFK